MTQHLIAQSLNPALRAAASVLAGAHLAFALDEQRAERLRSRRLLARRATTVPLDTGARPKGSEPVRPDGAAGGRFHAKAEVLLWRKRVLRRIARGCAAMSAGRT